MEDVSWDKIVDAIDEKFGLNRHGKTQEPLEDREDLVQHISFIEFTRAGQDYRLERVSRPAIIDKKSHYHKAASGGIRYQNIYDPEQIAHQTKMYRKSGDSWEPIDPSELAL